MQFFLEGEMLVSADRILSASGNMSFLSNGSSALTACGYDAMLSFGISN